MAKELKKQKGTFEFVGNLKEIKKGEKGLELYVYDKEIDSEVRLNIWNSEVARYYDNVNKRTVEITSNIEETMKEVKANNIGNPFGIELITPKGKKMYYVNNELIDMLCKTPSNKFNVRIKGNLDFSIYKDRVIKNYNISSIELLSGKQQHKLGVNFPFVISETMKPNLKYLDTVNTITGLVKTKLENGQYGYRPISLALDKNHLLGGFAVKVAKEQNLDVLDVINNKLMKCITQPMFELKGYNIMMISGRLKVGNISKKPTIEDLNPMEKILLEMQGEEAIKEKLESMDVIKEYFDSVIFETVTMNKTSSMIEVIDESELNLKADNDEVQQNSNPMLDILNSISNKQVEENKEEENIFGEISDEKTSDKLEDFVNKEESKTEELNESFEDDFPF